MEWNTSIFIKLRLGFLFWFFLCLCDPRAVALQHLFDVASCQRLHQQCLCTNDLGFSILTCLLNPSTFFTFRDFSFKTTKCKSFKFKFLKKTFYQQCSQRQNLCLEFLFSIFSKLRAYQPLFAFALNSNLNVVLTCFV
jgi:hypothetical protein